MTFCLPCTGYFSFIVGFESWVKLRTLPLLEHTLYHQTLSQPLVVAPFSSLPQALSGASGVVSQASVDSVEITSQL